ncbi:MAG: phage tail protein [Anaerolineae bacterium]
MPDDQTLGTVNAAFRFVVSVDGEGQAAFTQATLPTVEWETEPIKEGGLNTFVHQLPGQRKSAKLSLKNGVGKTALLNWYLECMAGPPTRKTVTITLLNVAREPVMIWHVNDAFPTRWNGPELQSDSKTVAIQTLELACGEVTASYE